MIITTGDSYIKIEKDGQVIELLDEQYDTLVETIGLEYIQRLLTNKAVSA